MLNISDTKRFMGSRPVGTLKESAYGASIGDVIHDVTRLYDIILIYFISHKMQQGHKKHMHIHSYKNKKAVL